MATKYSADATITGSLYTSAGKVTINEASEDYDFRVELLINEKIDSILFDFSKASIPH